GIETTVMGQALVRDSLPRLLRLRRACEIGGGEDAAAVGKLGFGFEPLGLAWGKRETFTKDRFLTAGFPDDTSGGQVDAGSGEFHCWFGLGRGLGGHAG